MHKPNNLKLDYLTNTIKLVLNHSNLTNYEIKDNIFYVIKAENGYIKIEYGIIDDKYKCLIRSRTKPMTNMEVINYTKLSDTITDLCISRCYNFSGFQPIPNYPFENICSLMVEICISNMIIYFENIGIKISKYDTPDNTHINIHTELYGIIQLHTTHIQQCEFRCMDKDQIQIYDMTFPNNKYSIKELCDSDNILSHPLFYQLKTKLNIMKYLKVLMLIRELVKEHLCTDLFIDIGTLIYENLSITESITDYN